MKIARLCMANGDEYENVTLVNIAENTISTLFEYEHLEIDIGGRTIVINPEFVVSYEFENKKLSVV